MRPRVVYRVFAFSTVVAVVSNLAVAWSVFVRTKHPVEYNVRVLEAPQPFQSSIEHTPSPTTNLAPAAVSAVSDPPQLFRQPSGRSYSYQYYEIGGRPGAFLHGRYYHVGDVHAFGIVSDIFPERIVFSSGDFIDNTSLERKLENDTIGSRPSPLSP